MMKKNWLVSYSKSTNPSLRLFCFHYAGGTASFCSKWANYLDNDVEVIAIQLPGRAQRISESCFTKMAPLVNELISAIKDFLDIPYAFFGHSMGAIISYEVICQMKRQGLRQPLIFFPAGRQAPRFPKTEYSFHHLPDDQFCDELLRRHYSDELSEILKNEDMRGLVLPQLRADFELSYTYSYCASDSIILGCRIIALDGADGDDCVSDEELFAWKEYTSNEFKCKRFSGGHFFIRNSEKQLLSLVQGELASIKSEIQRFG